MVPPSGGFLKLDPNNLNPVDPRRTGTEEPTNAPTSSLRLKVDIANQKKELSEQAMASMAAKETMAEIDLEAHFQELGLHDDFNRLDAEILALHDNPNADQ